jgi:putative ergosteryl-3beta-O-L-aspartate hydrolase
VEAQGWLFRFKVVWWRTLLRIAIILDYGRSNPRIAPSFRRRIRPTSCREKGVIDLQFYVAEDYHARRKRGKGYSVVDNFHGGGFTLGGAKDDGFWARVVLEEVDAVFVSVGYRLAPERPHPAAIDDGIEAIDYLAANAKELSLDPSRICF